ncbi:MAG: 1,4-dihydroxy-2-naphthoate octaprenyltransferase [Muribaculaceae bacterium]|nr:1,4-dihydroxy-2-naphthoate octaprenyltransferase [Muribaculaceae bacterium]
MNTTKLKCWVEAMRLRTLPVSLAGVVAACGYALSAGCFRAAPAALCAAFAVLAQIASNFANEYYDYTAGLDRAGREGPRRGVTEGDITPRAMLRATYLTLGVACMTGLSLVAWGGWWLVVAGAFIALGALAYSAGPYPLSRHGLGEVAVVVFFGVVPVCLTYYVQAGAVTAAVAMGSVAVGLMGANVLIVNNYRDMDDDRSVGKTTLAVRCGRPAVRALYLLNGIVAVALTLSAWRAMPAVARIVPVGYLAAHVALWRALGRRRGSAINPLLGMTAVLMLAYAAGFAAAALC